MADVLQQIDEVRKQAEVELAAVKTANDLEQFRIKYLGTKGQIKGLMKLLGQVPKEEKPAIGQRVNATSDEVTAAFEARKSSLGAPASSGPIEDVTEPGRRPQLGNRHILMKVVDELTELLAEWVSPSRPVQKSKTTFTTSPRSIFPKAIPRAIHWIISISKARRTFFVRRPARCRSA
jgi:phenylalanyl-tRNA synthetase alpha subunit